MDWVSSTIAQRRGEDWLVGASSQQFWRVFEARSALIEADLTQPVAIPPSKKCTPLILLAEPDPVDFLAGFFAAFVNQCDVLLANPNWGEREWAQVLQRFQPQFTWGRIPHAITNWDSPLRRGAATAGDLHHPANKSKILIPTGGSSGQLKFVVHTWQTLMASVGGFTQHFALNTVNAYCVLPVHHVSGLMQALRTFSTGGKLALQSFRELERGDRIVDNPTNYFLSLVPTQLQRLLDADLARWLTQFQAVLLGGAPAWPELLTQARAAKIPIALTYGMTETASQIATLHPQDFLAGLNSSGLVLPHAQIRVDVVKGSHGSAGGLAIRAESLGLGTLHLNDSRLHQLTDDDGWFYPDDVGCLDAQGYLHIVGRHSHKIITGGENVFPEEVEAAIWATGMVDDVGVVGVSDRVWGQAIAAIYVPKNKTVSMAQLRAALKPKLSGYKQPKRWIALSALPRNAQGKLNRQQARQIAAAASSQNL